MLLALLVTVVLASQCTESSCDKKLCAYVTGASGFFGHNVIEELLSEKMWDIYALVRGTSQTTASLKKNFPEGVHYVEGDITDKASLLRTIPHGCDAIFHLAADVSTWVGNNERQWFVNVNGTDNLIQGMSAFFILTSL